MSIKNNKPNKKGRFKQGYFNLNECKKYIGEGPIIYRSSWENKFCIYCETNNHVVKWSSEPFEIKYWNPIKEKYSKYHPDFFILLDDGKKLVIEVKPSNQIKKPEPPKRNTFKTIKNWRYLSEQYILNMAKFAAATKWCESRGYVFKIVTEDWFIGHA
jgi:hypothetical protein